MRTRAQEMTVNPAQVEDFKLSTGRALADQPIQRMAKLAAFTSQKNAAVIKKPTMMDRPVKNRMRFWCSESSGFFRRVAFARIIKTGLCPAPPPPL